MEGPIKNVHAGNNSIPDEKPDKKSWINSTFLSRGLNAVCLVGYLKAGHHVQEDCGEELGQVIAQLLAKN